MGVSEDKRKKKSFTGYIDEVWKYCIDNSDKCVVTGEKPFRKKEDKELNG